MKTISYLLTACVLLVVVPIWAQPTATATATADSTANVPADFGWPRQVSKDNSTLVYYQPQLDSWDDFKTLKGRMAFSLKTQGKTVMGVADLEARTMVDKDAHTVYFKKIDVKAVRFPALDEASSKDMEKTLKELLPSSGDPIALERLTAQLQDKEYKTNTVPVKNDPPSIFYSDSPAILLMVEGKPVLVPIDSSGMEFVVNTNWDLFYDKASAQYYLLVENAWLTAKELSGEWTPTRNLPQAMLKLPSGQNFDEVKKMIPPPSGAVAPKVFFSDQPAELITVNGPAKYVKVPNTNLLYVDNTENDVFADKSTGFYYVLISGRWFGAKDLKGPWSYAGDRLPADFAKIPKNSPRASVLSSVPGTVEASDAVLLAQVPTTAEVNKAEAEQQVKVVYDGEPQFKPIDGTSMQYATNTQEKIVKVGDLYYLCFQGVWFMSTTANGPWKTAESVPQEIYSIPPSSPVYNVTYVTQTNVNETTVESSTTAGYFGMFVMGMTVGVVLTFGTGYYYPPYMYWGPRMMYPVYRPWPCTYGVGAVYNPWTGGYAAGRRAYGPYGSAGTSAWYNPATGRYGRSASVQGWYGGRTTASSYNPWTGGYTHTNQGHNPYGQWGSSVSSRGGQWVQTGHVATAHGTVAGYQTSGGKSGVVAHGAHGGTAIKTNNGNGVYAGNDGNVYKKNSDGSWSQYNNKNGNWSNAGGGANGSRPGANGGGEQNPKATANGNRPGANGGGTQNPNAGKAHPQPANGGQRMDANGAGTQRAPQTNMADHTSRDLNNAANARQRGQAQTERFQRTQQSGGFGGNRGGGAVRGGGGMRGGGGGFGGRRR